MKRIFSWQVILGISLIFLSVVFYIIHYLIFRDARHIFIYLLSDIAFVFFEVFLVTLVLHHLLMYREKQAMLKKLNMVIGAFFGEAGTQLLRIFSAFNPQLSSLAKGLIITQEWTDRNFLRANKYFNTYEYMIDPKKGDLNGLKHFLGEKRDFLLRLLENPNLLEHEAFTNLLWAVFHLTEELNYRVDLNNLAEADLEHLSGDIKRAYRYLICEWLAYIKHLKSDYPYLFSLALRTNPFNPDARVEIK